MQVLLSFFYLSVGEPNSPEAGRWIRSALHVWNYKGPLWVHGQVVATPFSPFSPRGFRRAQESEQARNFRL